MSLHLDLWGKYFFYEKLILGLDIGGAPILVL